MTGRPSSNLATIVFPFFHFCVVCFTHTITPVYFIFFIPCTHLIPFFVAHLYYSPHSFRVKEKPESDSSYTYTQKIGSGNAGNNTYGAIQLLHIHTVKKSRASILLFRQSNTASRGYHK
ncbi:hypothetical protein BX661DRAFT_70750 [Kickxella alabastrina]|uniref:uncharacterized protein n=1 Tax=Kickxella alabastrina TaxID=61397 RepID=UPI0022209772|nr:uncharacterized protein BX661DRAFT_70750 [Kickxella alabastrina]KAI7820371.1 hypothetical protein BX661DRAFT_70750 [Kickxella alabastrina]